MNVVLKNSHEFHINLHDIKHEEFTIIIDQPENWPNCDIEYDERYVWD